MATIKYKEHFWNYDNISELTFHHKTYANGDDWYVTVYHYGMYTKADFKTEAEYLYAKKKLEEGLISNYVLIDLEYNSD